MDIVTLQAAKAALKGYHDSIFQGLPVVCSRSNGFTLNAGNLSDGTNTSANFRYYHKVLVSSTGVRLVFANQFNATGWGNNDITVKASVEWPEVSSLTNTGQAGVKVPVTFRGGQRSITIQPAAYAVSDPLPMKLTQGQFIYTRTYVSVASAGQKWPLDLYTKSGNWEGATKGAPATDLSDTSGIGQTSEAGYGPVAILGTPLAGKPDVVAIIGDSIIYGSGDTDPNGMGFAQRALLTANVPYMNIAKPGEQASGFIASSLLQAQPRLALVLGCTAFIEEYGRNDFANAVSLATMQTNKMTIWQGLRHRGMRGFATTITPGTTSTDAWATTANQTVTANEANRVALNAWLRDGAPMHLSSGAYVADTTGASGGSIARCAYYDATGALVTAASGPAHLLQGVFEVTDTVESARDSGKWKAPGYTTDGTHPTATGHAAAAAAIRTALFTAGS